MAEQERVLSEEDKDRWIEATIIKMERLEATIRDRDKTIAKQQELATNARELLSQIKIEMAEKDAEIERLRKALERIVKSIEVGGDGSYFLDYVDEIARQALAATGKEGGSQ